MCGDGEGCSTAKRGGVLKARRPKRPGCSPKASQCACIPLPSRIHSHTTINNGRSNDLLSLVSQEVGLYSRAWLSAWMRSPFWWQGGRIHFLIAGDRVTEWEIVFAARCRNGRQVSSWDRGPLLESSALIGSASK